MFSHIKTDSVKYLLVGYLALAVMFTTAWLMDSLQLNEQRELIIEMDLAAHKMRLIADLAQIVRKRMRLTHKMLSAEDVFRKDEIYQDIVGLQNDFGVRHRKLEKMELTERERQVLNDQLQIYPRVIEMLDQISVLTMEETAESDKKARSLLFHNIAPRQEVVFGGFMQILRNIQSEVKKASNNSLQRYRDNEFYRVILALAVFLASLGILIWLISRILMIERRLQALSRSDGLTGISNRRCFDERLSHEWDRGCRTRDPLSLLLIDIDFFKSYNDHYGHQAGDQCLIQVAKEIKKIAHRANDFAARYGGEEFTVVLPNTGEAGAIQVADHLLTTIRGMRLPHQGSEIEGVLTVSIGVATVIPTVDADSEYLIKMADKGLYAAKKNGRNRYEVYPKPPLSADSVVQQIPQRVHGQ